MKNSVRVPVLIKRAAAIVRSSPGSFNGVNVANLIGELSDQAVVEGKSRLEQLTELASVISNMATKDIIKLHKHELFRPLFPANFDSEKAMFRKNDIGEDVLSIGN